MKNVVVSVGNGTSIGYHYTTWSNWLKIQKKGLVPYQIQHPELKLYFKKDVPLAIWVWDRIMEGEEHIGSILYQVSIKQELKVVKLQVEYEYDSMLKFGKRPIQLTHNGVIGNWYYHKQNVTSRLVTAAIPPKKIKLLEVYDLEELLK